MSSARIYRIGIRYGIKKYLKSLRFWENQIWTSHKFSNVHFFLWKEHLLRALEPNKRAFLEIEKILFPRQASKGQFLLMWKLPKDSTSASLGIVWAHKSIFQHTMESCPSLGSPSIMYQGREGYLKARLYKPTKRWTMVDHKVMLAKVAQATPAVFVNQGAGAEEEDSIIGHPTILAHYSGERESWTASEGKTGRTKILASGPRATA